MKGSPTMNLFLDLSYYIVVRQIFSFVGYPLYVKTLTCEDCSNCWVPGRRVGGGREAQMMGKHGCSV